jgi:hypothetical protein
MMRWSMRDSVIGLHLVVLMLLILLSLSSGIGSATEKMKGVSGVGTGELVLNFTIQDTAQVFSGRYSYDLLSIRIPPIDAFNVTSTKKLGYSYTLPGIYIPGKPNDFTVTTSKVKNLNIGLKKDPVKTGINHTRIWVASQTQADTSGNATITSDLLSPGSYQIKIFGDAVENVTQVNLTMTLVKKIIINGRFNLGINTTGFPSGNYSLTAKALNGSLCLDEIKLEDISIAD